MRTPFGHFHPSLTRWGMGVLLVALTGGASAAVLYEQSPQDDGPGYFANANTPQQMADDFTLGSAASLDGITWWGSDNGSDAFVVRLFNGIGGTGTLLQAFNSPVVTQTGTALTDEAQNPVFRYDFSLGSAFSLAAGTYYLSVQTDSQGLSDWSWLQGVSSNGDFWTRGEDTDNWVSPTDGQGQALRGDLAFRLNGIPAQVPEPGILGLLMLAGAGLALARRRNPG